MSETTYERNVKRRRMIEAIELVYPIDSENAGALRFVNGDEPAEPAPRYVLIQTHHNGRRWHEFADSIEGLLEYAASDPEWNPFCLVDLDSGDAHEVKTKCYLDTKVMEAFKVEPEPPSVPVESIRSILSYSWADEAEDFEVEGEPEHHIFRDLERVSEWLDAILPVEERGV